MEHGPRNKKHKGWPCSSFSLMRTSCLHGGHQDEKYMHTPKKWPDIGQNDCFKVARWVTGWWVGGIDSSMLEICGIYDLGGSGACGFHRHTHTRPCTTHTRMHTHLFLDRHTHKHTHTCTHKHILHTHTQYTRTHAHAHSVHVLIGVHIDTLIT